RTERKRPISLVVSLLLTTSRTCPRSFHCYRTLREPHSFPTRRSSDLAALTASWVSDLPRRRRLRRSGRLTSTTRTPSAARWTARSEEHTSELQSLAYLVCRLLLEKKNKLGKLVGLPQLLRVAARPRRL